MVLKKGDFIEIEFTARTKEGEIFDSNIKEDLKNSNLQVDSKPFILALGEGMFLRGVEDFLIGKEKDKHNIELSADKAFGRRNSKLIQRMSEKMFREHNLRPVPGHMFNFDGRFGKVLTVSGGRVIVDFNNPIAGKDVVYDVNILREVKDINEKINALNEFLFKRKIDFDVKDNKIILKMEKPFIQYAQMFSEKYKDVLGMELEVIEKQDEKQDNSKETSPKKSQ